MVNPYIHFFFPNWDEEQQRIPTSKQPKRQNKNFFNPKHKFYAEACADTYFYINLLVHNYENLNPKEMYAQSQMSGHSSVGITNVRTPAETTDPFKHGFFHADTPFLLGTQ